MTSRRRKLKRAAKAVEALKKARDDFKWGLNPWRLDPWPSEAWRCAHCEDTLSGYVTEHAHVDHDNRDFHPVGCTCQDPLCMEGRKADPRKPACVTDGLRADYWHMIKEHAAIQAPLRNAWLRAMGDLDPADREEIEAKIEKETDRIRDKWETRKAARRAKALADSWNGFPLGAPED